jgi:quercetin dioxygenase-like cupin family protein
MAESAKPETEAGKASELTRLPHLADSILQFDISHEITQLRMEDSWQRGTGRSSKTLVKHPDFRIVLTLMKPGSRMHEHRTDARISIQAVMGRIKLHLPQRTVELSAGQLLALDSEVPHDVEAEEEGAFLLTVGSLQANSQ